MRSPLQSSTARNAPTIPDEDRAHVCGKCRNPWTTGNPNCPNAPKDGTP